MATTGGLTLTTTVWVVHRVHGDTTNGWANTLPAHAAGLTPVDVDCSALPTSPTVARQRTSTLRISPEGIRSWRRGLPWRPDELLLRQSGHLCAPTGLELDRVDHGSHWDVAQWQVVTGLDVSTRDPTRLVTLT